ncbi:MAG: VWA domain-containing protein [Acidobacteria bacterium]|nr:VWA domain-containing protein [Acidobacteriota bacterium]
MRWLAVVLICSASAQVVLNPPKDAGTLTVDVNVVGVYCSVRDKAGNFVIGLKKEDFDVRDEGKKRAISYFSGEASTPLTVALMIDVSGSVASFLEEEKIAAGRFFREVLQAGDQAMVIGFGARVVVWKDMTQSIDELVAGLADVKDMPPPPNAAWRGGTQLYSSVHLVGTRKLRRTPGRKAMILITDGVDSGSAVNRESAIRAAQESDSIVYVIHYGDEALGEMEKLVEPTGGKVFSVSKDATLRKAFKTIGDELRHLYALGYTLPEDAKAGQYRKLDVKTPKAQVRVRAGYFVHR